MLKRLERQVAASGSDPLTEDSQDPDVARRRAREGRLDQLDISPVA
jgi:hypothetical protein